MSGLLTFKSPEPAFMKDILNWEQSAQQHLHTEGKVPVYKMEREGGRHSIHSVAVLCSMCQGIVDNVFTPCLHLPKVNGDFFSSHY